MGKEGEGTVCSVLLHTLLCALARPPARLQLIRINTAVAVREDELKAHYKQKVGSSFALSIPSSLSLLSHASPAAKGLECNKKQHS